MFNDERQKAKLWIRMTDREIEKLAKVKKKWGKMKWAPNMRSYFETMRQLISHLNSANWRIGEWKLVEAVGNLVWCARTRCIYIYIFVNLFTDTMAKMRKCLTAVIRRAICYYLKVNDSVITVKMSNQQHIPNVS